MAETRSFHALRYDQAVAPLETVLTQPYDKISPQMQAEYYQRSPYNLVRFELGKSQPKDNERDNPYTRARDFLAQLRREGRLLRDPEPAIYLYRQRFRHPLCPEQRIERNGFIALGRLHEYSEHVVHPHERTLSAPKEDRFRLLSTTRTHSGQLFMLYDDPQQEVDELLNQATMEREESAFVVDEYGVESRIWQIADPQIIDSVAEMMLGHKLIIADGHHRYETALRYRKHSGVDPESDAPENFTMMTFVNMAAPGLLILPTHRVLAGVPFDENKLLDELGRYFELSVDDDTSTENLLAKLSEAGKDATALAMVTAHGRHLLRANPARVDAALHSLHELERRLDVAVLHQLILGQLLGISEKATSEQRNLRYQRSAEAAVQEVRDGAQAAFLMNPVSITQMRDLTFAGRVMPQKSTDFYPKLLSGLTLYALDAQSSSGV